MSKQTHMHTHTHVHTGSTLTLVQATRNCKANNKTQTTSATTATGAIKSRSHSTYTHTHVHMHVCMLVARAVVVVIVLERDGKWHVHAIKCNVYVSWEEVPHFRHWPRTTLGQMQEAVQLFPNARADGQWTTRRNKMNSAPRTVRERQRVSWESARACKVWERVWETARESVHVCRMYNCTCICTFIQTYIRSVFFSVTACNAVIIDAVWPSTLPPLVVVVADVALFCRLIHSRDFLPNTLTKRREQTVPAQCHKATKMCIIITCELQNGLNCLLHCH